MEMQLQAYLLKTREWSYRIRVLRNVCYICMLYTTL